MGLWGYSSYGAEVSWGHSGYRATVLWGYGVMGLQCLGLWGHSSYVAAVLQGCWGVTGLQC